MSGGIVAAVSMLVLFPGFIGLKVLEAITDCRHRTEFDKLGIVVGFSLVVYMAYLCVATGVGLPNVPVSYETSAFQINGRSVLAIGLLSFALPFGVGVVMNRGWLSGLNYNNWIADRDIGGPSSVWIGAFDDLNDKWIRVHLVDGVVIEGKIKWYSDDGEEQHEIFLGEASFRSVKEEWASVAGPGVLIAKDAPTAFIEFLDGEDADIHT